jgi:hypothetical protein
MAIGDIKISTLKIGEIDLTNQSSINFSGIEIIEDILSPTGPFAEFNIIDSNDVLGQSNLNGSYDKDVQITFSLADIGGPQANFKFKMLQNKNLKDGSTENQGSGHNKQYSIRCCSAEMLAAQGNYVKKSYNQPTSKMVEDIVKNNFKSDKSIDTESTFGSRRFVFSNEHPINALRKLNDQHVSDQNKSSAFILFQQCDNGNQKYVFSTFEKLFQQGPVVQLKQSTNLNSSSTSGSDMQNSIMWINVPDSFFTLTRSLSKVEQNSYDPTSGTTDQVSKKKQQFKFADNNGVYSDSPSVTNCVPVHTAHDAANNKSPTKLSEAKQNRLDFLSQLSQNHGTLEIPGNPQIKLGSMISLDIPNKTDNNTSSGEKQFNGNALVVSIRHKIKPVGQNPRYTMILGVVKGSYKEGGGGNG